MMVPAPRPLVGVRPYEAAFLNLVRSHGNPAPDTKRIAAQPAIANDTESDCWTHAWNVAQQLGAWYVEGVCIRPAAGGPSMHAWVEEDSAFGAPRLVEVTPGYEHATRYLGLRIDASPLGPAAQATSEWDPDAPRASLLQVAFLNGANPKQVLARYVVKN